MLNRIKITLTSARLNENTDFLNGIPTNTIVFKRKPGIGATYAEIENNDHNSIILEPNTPVLEGKRDAIGPHGNKLHPNILIVYKGIEIPAIMKYLTSDITPKKILCTPEAYTTKVKRSIMASGFNLYQDFYMLFDECDRLIKDSDYRKKITMPMKDFFKFESKAMISATAIEPSDERFLQHGFKILELVPLSNEREKLNLIATNNILESLRKVKDANKGKKIFVFLNSTKLAVTIIRRLDVEDKSRIYCSSSAVQKLKKKCSYYHGKSKLKDFSDFNVLTSKYYSAVDIMLDEKPVVVMITDVLRRSFTMLDPYTDVIQIIGRFRNGVHSSNHITNFSIDMPWMTDNEGLKFINDSYNCYKTIKDASQLHTTNEGGKQTLEEALDATSIKNFIDDETGKINSFMLDNFQLEQRVRHSYLNFDNLKQSYSDTNYFVIKLANENYDVNDGAMLILEKQLQTKESNKVIADILFNYHKDRVQAFLQDPLKAIAEHGDTIATFTKECPKLVFIYNNIGYYGMEDLEFDLRRMESAAKKEAKKNELSNRDLFKEVHKVFKIGEKYIRKEIKEKLQILYTKFEISKAATGSDIELFFEVKPRPVGNIKHFEIVGLKQVT